MGVLLPSRPFSRTWVEQRIHRLLFLLLLLRHHHHHRHWPCTLAIATPLLKAPAMAQVLGRRYGLCGRRWRCLAQRVPGGRQAEERACHRSMDRACRGRPRSTMPAHATKRPRGSECAGGRSLDQLTSHTMRSQAAAQSGGGCRSVAGTLTRVRRHHQHHHQHHQRQRQRQRRRYFPSLDATLKL